MRRLLFLAPLLVFAALLVYFALGLQRDPQRLPSVLIDQPVPDFDLPPVPGSAKPGLSSAGLKGQVQLVNVFASWCAPCRIEQPVLLRLARDEKLPIQGINYKDKADAALTWLTKEGDPYQAVGFDQNGRTAIDWGVYGVPETFIVDRDGRIRYRFPGPLTPDVVEREIMPRLKELSK
jgi:cytochrome c biogenesis protein CcmG/thiol:disulfide interchange protein DsbE